MHIDDFLKLVQERRSIRRFKPTPIPDEYVEKIMEAGRWAMSGANAQPWEFIVVKDQKTKDEIAQASLELRQEQHIIEMTRLEELRHPMVSKPPTVPGFKDAPVLIVVVGDKRTFQATILATNFIGGEAGPGGAYIKSMGNAVTHMHLAAAVLGLGSQWVSLNRIWEESVKEILDIPSAIEIHTIVAIGYPAYIPKQAYRRELEEIVHHDKYDRSRYRSGQDIVEYIKHLRRQAKGAYE